MTDYESLLASAAPDPVDTPVGHDDIGLIVSLAIAPFFRTGGLAVTLAGFVVPSQDVEFDEDDLLAWAADRLQRLDVLREIRLVDVIPRNPAGKVLRHRLRAVASDADDT